MLSTVKTHRLKGVFHTEGKVNSFDAVGTHSVYQ